MSQVQIFGLEDDYCASCYCSIYCCDDECDCECHGDNPDFGDGEEDSLFAVDTRCSCGADVGLGESHDPECPYA